MKVKIWVEDKLANTVRYDNDTKAEDILKDIPKFIRNHTKKKRGKLIGIRRVPQTDAITDIYFVNQAGPMSGPDMAKAARRRRSILGFNVMKPGRKPVCPQARPSGSRSTDEEDYEHEWFRGW